MTSLFSSEKKQKNCSLTADGCYLNIDINETVN